MTFHGTLNDSKPQWYKQSSDSCVLTTRAKQPKSIGLSASWQPNLGFIVRFIFATRQANFLGATQSYSYHIYSSPFLESISDLRREPIEDTFVIVTMCSYYDDRLFSTGPSQSIQFLLLLRSECNKQS